MARDARTRRRFVLLVVGLCAAGCGQRAPVPTDGPGKPSPDAPPTPAVASLEKPDFTLDAAAWREEWKKDRTAAKKKYTGKVVELTGEVVFVMVQFEGSIAGGDLRSGPGGWVNLKGAQEGFPVQCITTDPQPWLTVSEGSKVRVRGRAGKVDAEELVDCIIVEAGPNPALTATVEQITRDVAADSAAAKEKYD